MASKLNIGCGKNWRTYEGYNGLDIVDFGQDYIGNVLTILPILSDGTLTEVMANHFLEHFSQEELKVIFSNVNRLLKDGGIFKFVIPHLSKDRSWILPHKTFWNEVTVRWLGEEDTDKVYGFGKWEVVEVITNERKDMHVILRKVI